MRPGSLPWLLKHEVRVRWREMLGDTKPIVAVTVGFGLFVLAHVVLLLMLGPLLGTITSPLPPEFAIFAGLALLVLMFFGLAIGVNHGVRALFERGDLDLLVSSPVSSRTIFASRVLGVAVGVFVTLGLVLVPVAIVGAILGLPQLLGALPTLVAVALISASLSMLVTIALVRLLGPRRARTFVQALAALAGLVFFLMSQVPALLGDDADVAERLQGWVRYFEPGGPLAPDSAVWLPARALLLDPLATVVTLAFAGLLTWATIALLHNSFARGLGLVEAPRRRSVRREGAEMRFSAGGSLRNLMDKEWRLIRRDPFLISQTLLQVVYLLPAAYIIFFTDGDMGGRFSVGPALATIVVAVAGTLSANLARICVAGEESADLLTASPTPGALVRRAKLLAALVPVWVLCVPLVVGLVLYSPLAGIAAAVMVAVSTLCVATIRLWNPVRTARQDLFRRNRSQGDPILGIIEGVLPLVLGVATYLLAVVSPWALAVLAVGAAMVAACFMRARQRGLAFGV